MCFLLLFIVLLLHVLGGLFKGSTCLCVDLGHLFYKIAGGGIGERVVVGGVGKDSWVLSVEYREGTLACCAVNPIVVGKFSQWEPVAPVGLLVVNEDLEILLDFLVDSFSLSVGLWVECS